MATAVKISAVIPQGTVRLDNKNTAAGISVAYDANGKALGFVKTPAAGTWSPPPPKSFLTVTKPTGQQLQQSAATAQQETSLPISGDVTDQLGTIDDSARTQLDQLDFQQGDYLSGLGVKTTPRPDGSGKMDYALDYTDPRSRAYKLQESWKAAKSGALQTAGHHIGDGSYVNQVESNNRGEITDNATLIGDAQRMVDSTALQRASVVAGSGVQKAGVMSEWAKWLAANPNAYTVPKAPAAPSHSVSWLPGSHAGQKPQQQASAPSVKTTRTKRAFRRARGAAGMR